MAPDKCFLTLWNLAAASAGAASSAEATAASSEGDNISGSLGTSEEILAKAYFFSSFSNSS